MHYANLKDRILLKEGNKQIYGTNLSYDQEKKINYFDVNTLENLSGVDARRKELEMESMSDFLKHLNIESDMTK